MKRRVSIAAFLVVVAGACGGGASGPAADEQTDVVAPVQPVDGDDAVLGSELAGHTFDVRRDPG